MTPTSRRILQGLLDAKAPLTAAELAESTGVAVDMVRASMRNGVGRVGWADGDGSRPQRFTLTEEGRRALAEQHVLLALDGADAPMTEAELAEAAGITATAVRLGVRGLPGRRYHDWVRRVGGAPARYEITEEGRRELQRA